MSLHAIARLRRLGHKPSGVVRVLIGAKPGWLDDDEKLVVVAPHDDPRLMDWRPVVGLQVALFSAVGVPAQRTLAVIDALESQEAQLFGAADERGAYPMTLGAGVEHEQCLRGQWELLCQ